MGDPCMRKSSALNRLRNQLKKKRESLADHFEFKMYIIFHFKEKKKKSAIYEISEVLPVMTNNYEESILRGAKNDAYSMESSLELLEKDVVQFHAPRWQPMRSDIIGCTTDVDYFLWPRNDIERIECCLFSRWKKETCPFKQIQANFEFQHTDFEKQVMCLLTRKEKNGLIINNPDQSVFLFIDRVNLQLISRLWTKIVLKMKMVVNMSIKGSLKVQVKTTYRTMTQAKTVTILKLASVCLYLPQDQLMAWSTGTIENTINTLLETT